MEYKGYKMVTFKVGIAGRAIKIYDQNGVHIGNEGGYEDLKLSRKQARNKIDEHIKTKQNENI